jgi:tripartite-type tricarboxylate transporter receptor subunit TctC
MLKGLAGLFSHFAAAMLLVLTGTAQGKADEYPSKEIQIIVGFNAGGGVDAISRIVAKHAPKYWGTDAVIVNKPGGGGSIAWNTLLRGKADGYTLAAGVIPNIIYQPAVRSADTPGYQTDDLIQIGTVSRIPSAIFVRQDSKWNTLADFLADAKAEPGKLSMGVIGPNTVTDGLRVLVEQAADVKFQRVVFKGGAPMSKQLLGGHIDAMVSNAMFAITMEDKLRPLGVASLKPFPLAPDAPTFAGQGYKLEDYVWRGIVAPKGTPEDRVAHLRAGLSKMVQDPEFLEDMKKAGIFTDFVDPEETRAFIADFADDRKKVIADFKQNAN